MQIRWQWSSLVQDIEIDINGSRELLQSLPHGLSQHLDLNAWVVVQSSYFVESTPKVVLLLKEIQLHCLLPDWIGMCKNVQCYKNVFHMHVELAIYDNQLLYITSQW